VHWNFEWTIWEGSIGPFGPIELRWYGVLFALGLLLCAYWGPRYFELWGMPRQHAERLTLWVPVGMLLGAHYIHLAFYETDGLFDFPRWELADGSAASWTEIFRATPLASLMELGEGEVGHFVLGRFFGLGSGLASHGGGLGCVLGVLLFWWRHGRHARSADGRSPGFWRYTDPTMVASVWVYPFVRLGNFANSEIWGRVTDGPFGVIFDRRWEIGGEAGPPRHPVVLYEAVLYFCELAFAIWLQKRYARKWRAGSMFLFLLGTHFTLRFFAEFFKESQGVDEGWALNMGHWLSVPVITACYGLVFFSRRFNINTPLTAEELEENARTYRDASELGAPEEPEGRDADAEQADATEAPSEGEPAPAVAAVPAKRKKKKKSG
jgi:prolipoprotein diacylglyceryl transferase